MNKKTVSSRAEYLRAYYLAHKKEITERTKEYSQRPEVKQRDRERLKIKYQEHRGEHIRNIVEVRQLRKVRVLGYYSNPQGHPICNNCGEQDIDVLCLDHITGNGGEHRREIKETGTGYYRWVEKNNYPKGYQVLCCNCNHKKELFK